MYTDQYYWSWLSLLIYLVLAFVGMICAKNALRHNSDKLLNRHYIVWYVVWLFFTVWRDIRPGIGGTDAFRYIDYYEHCLDPTQTNLYAYRTEIGWRLLNKALRHITADYHLLFILVYSVLIWAIIYFVHEFYNYYVSCIPIITAFYSVLISFNIVRNGLAFGLLLISIIKLYKNENVKAVIIATVSIFIHASAIFYFGFIVFYWLYKRRGSINIKKAIVWSILGAIACRIVQSRILSGNFKFINSGTPIDVYASSSLHSGFFEDWWKMVVSQLLLIIALAVLVKPIRKYIRNVNDVTVKSKMQYVQLMVYYDLLLVPAAYILHVWRAVDYFLLPRIIMWGLIISTIKAMLPMLQRRYVGLISLVLTVGYLIFRIYTVYDISSLMPYGLAL